MKDSRNPSNGGTAGSARRRVIIADCGPDDGKLGTVYATYPPDYSTVMIDGLTRLQAFREGELRDAPNGMDEGRRTQNIETTTDAL